MSASAPVLIAGGGIGGLATAIALAQRGIASRVLERREEFSEAGAGIQIGPNGVQALRRIGVDALLAPSVGRPEAIVVREGRTGQVLTRLPLGRWVEDRHGAPYWAAHRRDVQAALLTRVAQEPLIEIMPGFDVASFIAADASVRVHDTTGKTADGIALAAADGQHSLLRRRLFPASALRFSGKTASRTILDVDAVAGSIDAGTTGVWLAPGVHVVHYPVRAGREVAVVVIITDEWQDDDWGAAADREKLMTAVEQFSPALLRVLHRASDWRRWSLYDAEPLKSWTSGRVTLLGDAAHPVLPFLAQGGSMALEDAVVLANCFAASRDVESALMVYERKRIARTARVIKASRRNGRIFHLSALAASARNALLRTLPGTRLMAGYDWLYGWKGDG